MSKEIDHEFTDKIVCPYCREEVSDSWELDGECGEVGKNSNYTVFNKKNIMGLDMYLTAELYISEFDDNNIALINSMMQHAPRGLGEFTPRTASFELAYWRKANAIHGWFVKHVQDGKDECQDSYVSLKQLHELKDICEKVLADVSLASELLPTTKGFFFGSYEYDEWFTTDLRNTVDKLDKILKNPDAKKWAIQYHASW